MQVFYGKVLRNKELSTEEKQQQVKAILDHYAKDATHEHCPSGASSWCKRQVDATLGTASYKPVKDPLSSAIVQVNAMIL